VFVQYEWYFSFFLVLVVLATRTTATTTTSAAAVATVAISTTLIINSTITITIIVEKRFVLVQTDQPGFGCDKHQVALEATWRCSFILLLTISTSHRSAPSMRQSIVVQWRVQPLRSAAKFSTSTSISAAMTRQSISTCSRV
jgi:hypothetical protein